MPKMHRPLLQYSSFVFALLLLSTCSTTRTVQTPGPNKEIKCDKHATATGGMWLLPQIEGEIYTQMKAAGLQLPAASLYHPSRTSLSQGVVQINIHGNSSGTGAFVSDRGLILTSYRAAYNALVEASKTRKDLANGFTAESKAEEIPIPSYKIRILIEQKEVTDQINSQLSDSLTYREKNQRTKQIKQQLIAERKAGRDNLVVEINDAWAGNRHFVSVYQVIDEVRLVHAPTESVGDLGGADKNYEWPRHAGSYALLRAYEDSSNQTASGSSKVPFRPDHHFTINTSGISSGDFTMTMGYPGQSSRHHSSYALEFYYNQRNPIMIKSYRAILDGLQHATVQDSQQALQNASQRASAAINLKYYRGIQRGIEEHNLIERKRNIENQFNQWIKKDSLRMNHYQRVLNQLEQAYNIATQTGDLLYAIVNTLNKVRLWEVANLYHSYRKVLADSSRTNVSRTYKDSLLAKHRALLDNINVEAQQITLSQMLEMLATLPEGKVMFHLIELFGDARGNSLQKKINNYLKTQRHKSIVFNLDRAKAFLDLPIDSARSRPVDEIVELYRALIENYQFSRKNYLQHTPYRSPAQERYVEGMRQFRPDSLRYPDANSTLRISTGQVQGFSPQDSVYYPPFTTLEGLTAGDTDQLPFDVSRVLKQYSYSTNSRSTDMATKTDTALTVNFLSTNDFTGGSTGRPILDNQGKLVGLSFDRAFQGIASDYHNLPQVSRSINIDIRFVLSLLEHNPKTKQLLLELLDQEDIPQN